MAIICLAAAFLLPAATNFYSYGIVFVPLLAWCLAYFGGEVSDLVGLPVPYGHDYFIRVVGLLMLTSLSGSVLYLWLDE